MRRYKIVACILLIFSVFSSVLAAPVAVQDVREACSDEVYGDGGENAIIGFKKRAGEGSNLLDESDSWFWKVWPRPPNPVPDKELSSSSDSEAESEASHSSKTSDSALTQAQQLWRNSFVKLRVINALTPGPPKASNPGTEGKSAQPELETWTENPEKPPLSQAQQLWKELLQNLRVANPKPRTAIMTEG